jgi:hypothetical protein
MRAPELLKCSARGPVGLNEIVGRFKFDGFTES